MKKQNGSRISNLIRRIFNVRWWIDFDRIKSFALYIKDIAQKLFIPQASEGTEESFTQAMKELNLKEEDIVAKEKGLYQLSLIMFTVAILIFIYLIIQLFIGTLKSILICLVLVCLAIVLAFRYHFWYFQIKKRRLGCSISEWYREGLLGGKHE